VEFVVVEPEAEVEFGRGEGHALEVEAEAVDEAAEEKEQRFEGFDHVFEFHLGGEAARRGEGLDGAGAFAGGAFPEGETAGAESLGDIGFGEGGELAESGDAP